jgi:hypothetical protein
MNLSIIKKEVHMKKTGKKLISIFATITMIVQICLTGVAVTVKAETASVFTDYLPSITQVTDAGSFTHPGVGLTKEILENLRTKIRAGAEPWNFYFNSQLLTAAEASRTISSSNSSDGINPSADAFNSQSFNSKFIADGLKAYTQALMYYITGDEVYRTNAMMIIRIWEKMDPDKYAYFTDAHIHTGIPLNRMVMAAEILRYTDCQTESLKWNEEDTTNFTKNLITPAIETFMHEQNRFMNQHGYSLIGSMAGYIFTGNRDRYNEAVEWFTVNNTAIDQGFNGSVKQLFRWVTEEQKVGDKVGEGIPVTPHVQHIEMGRDQAHGGGDLTNAALISRLMSAQKTKVDPDKGTVSTESNAKDTYEFLNNRILGAADYFWQYMLGYDMVWTPQAYAITGGDPNNGGLGGFIRDTYNRISGQYKGRFLTANFWDIYSYYTYVKKQDVSKMAPYYYEAFTKKLTPIPSGWSNVDAGNDFWLYLPSEAEADAAKFVTQNKSTSSTYELEDRYTNLTKLDNSKDATKDNIDTNAATTITEDATVFVRLKATEAGSKIAILSFATAQSALGFRIRTNGPATLNVVGNTLVLPNTNGEWKYVTATGTITDYTNITVKGSPGINVDIDNINVGATQLTAPVFKTGSSDLNIFSYIGVPIGRDFSATDSSTTDVVTYSGFNMPQGSVLNASTGAFSWIPTEAGKKSFVVSVSDGTTVTAKNVNIIVTSDRTSAVQAVILPYNKDKIYEKASLDNYNAAYNNTLSMLSTASDSDFCSQLITLRTAVESLKLVTPLLSDGTMDFSQISTANGVVLSSLVDNDSDTFTGFRSGSGNLYNILDFGSNYKISASAFGLQARMNFVDRGAGSVVYGSNDNENWTRLTTQETAFTPDLSVIPVDDQYKNTRFRYIKIEQINSQPDIIHGTVQNIIEWGELRIYGQRYESDNKIASISISSPDSYMGKITLGSAVKVNIKAKEAINNLKVKIQGKDATVFTTDNINWIAAANLTEKEQVGSAKVIVDYQKQDGTNGDTIYGTTDDSKLLIVDDSDVINNIVNITNLIDPSKHSPRPSAAETLKQVNMLFDNNISTASDFRDGANGNSGSGSYITFDFKASSKALLSGVEIIARQDQVGRIGGVMVQGSDDNTAWTTISTKAVAVADWQLLKISNTTPYRYIRIYNSGAWYGNMAELKFHGKVVSPINDALNKASAINRSMYTSDSLQVLDTAVASANTVLTSTIVTQADLDTASYNLLAALNALQYISGMPVLESIADQTVIAGNKITFQVKATNVTNVTYSVDNLPTGASFNTTTETVEWTPSIDQGGVYNVTFNATAGSLTSSKTIKIKVIGKPVIGSSEDTLELTAEQPLTFNLTASDPSGETLAYKADNLPVEAVLNSKTGKLSWTPTQADYGSHAVTFIVSNGTLSAEKTLIFNVKLQVLPAADYTKGSYYIYSREMQRIQAAISKQGADKVKLAAEIAVAEKALVKVPLSLYSFEDNANNSYGSAAGGVVGTTAYSTGKLGKAVDLNGTNSYVKLPATTPVATSNEVTIATWVYWRGGSNWQRIFDFGNSTTQYVFLSPSSGSNTLRFAIKNGGGEQLVETTKLSTNQWVHVAVTIGSNTAKLYVNGALKATNTAFTIKPSDFKPSVNYIGKSQVTADPLYNGLVDEFSVLDHVLTADEIQAMYSKASVNWIDKSLLTLLIEEFAAIDRTLYSQEDILAIETAIEQANNVSANIDATQSQIDDAAGSLQAVLEKLKPMIEVERLLPQAGSFKLGDSAKVRIRVTNNAVESKNVALIAALFDANNHMVVYGASQSSVEALKQTDLEVMMNIPLNGNYTVKYFVWDSLDTQQPIQGIAPGVIPVNSIN